MALKLKPWNSRLTSSFENLKIMVFFLIITLVLRSSSFFASVIDQDESLYLLMARSLLEGNPPYSMVWDNKPPGVYYLFAIALFVLGKSIVSIRILGWIAVSVSCYLLYRLGIVLADGEDSVGILAGLLFAVFSLNNGGLASNTEIFFIPFIIAAFLLHFGREPVLSRMGIRELLLRYFVIGLLIGFAFEIKQIVIFDLMALLLVLISSLWVQGHGTLRERLGRIVLVSSFLGIGFIAPFLIVSLYFLLIGQFQPYLYSNFVANTILVSGQSFSLVQPYRALKLQIRGNSLLWLCFCLSFVYLFAFSRDIGLGKRRRTLALIVWAMMALLGANFTRFYYAHYYLQLLPPLSLLSASLITRVLGLNPGLDRRRRLFLLVLVLAGPLFWTSVGPLTNSVKYVYYRYWKGLENWGDEPMQVAKHLENQVSEDDYIFVVGEPIVYFLVSARAPTKYVFSDFLVDEHFSRVAGTDPISELEKIMEKRPIYVVTRWRRQNPFFDELDSYLEEYYHLERLINDIELYRLRGDLGTGPSVVGQNLPNHEPRVQQRGIGLHDAARTNRGNRGSVRDVCPRDRAQVLLDRCAIQRLDRRCQGTGWPGQSRRSRTLRNQMKEVWGC